MVKRGVSVRVPDVHVGTDDGNVQLTRDGGASWTNLIDEMPGAPGGGWVPQICASSHAAGEAFVVMEDHRRDDWTPHVFYTRDFREGEAADSLTSHGDRLDEALEEFYTGFAGESGQRRRTLHV